jgi:DnaJ-class molecular chaperone
MTIPIKCPECNGTGCDPEPLEAPADGTFYLFPRCALCRGLGTLTPAQQKDYARRQKRRSSVD